VTSLSINDVDSSDECDRSRESAELKDALFSVVEELVMSEERYVSRLDILVMVKKRTHSIISPDVAKSMFQNIDSIQKFHHDSFYPRLCERLSHWSTCKRIGDIMSTCAPFLKLYTDYVTNLKTATNLVDVWTEKSKKFAAFANEIKENERLSLQAYMLEPIQRVPRYELLLREYLKKLPEDSDDRPDTIRAMEMVSDVASHFETMLKRDARMSELIEVQRQLIGTKLNLVSHNRHLLRRGNVTIIHPSGRRVDRTAFLFSDLLLVCLERPLVSRYQAKYEFWLRQCQVQPGNNLAIPNTFIIKAHHKALELAFSTAEEGYHWEQELSKQIDELTKKKLVKQSVKAVNDVEPEVKTVRYAAYGLGVKPPVMAPKSCAQQCHQCEQELFTRIHKHHCRACGHVFCSTCSSGLAWLPYCRERMLRICDGCFSQLPVAQNTGINGRRWSSNTVDQEQQPQVSVKGNILEKGYMQISADGGVTWLRRWLCVYDSGIMSTFISDKDVVPMASVQLDANSAVQIMHVNLPQTKAIAITCRHKSYILHDVDCQATVQSWFDVLTCLVSRALPQMVYKKATSV
jgi:hypothetical protein